MMPTGIGEGQLHSAYIFESQSHPETPSQTHPGMFYQLSGHLFTQAGKYTKSTITRKHCEVAYSGSWYHSLGPNLSVLQFPSLPICLISFLKTKCSFSFSPILLIPTPTSWEGRGTGNWIQSRGQWFSQPYLCNETPVNVLDLRLSGASWFINTLICHDDKALDWVRRRHKNCIPLLLPLPYVSLPFSYSWIVFFIIKFVTTKIF